MAGRHEAGAWCASYIEAFNAADAGKITAHWSFPALIYQAGGRMVFDKAEKFTRSTQALLDFYEREGAARAERELVDCLEMGPDGLAITVSDRMLAATGEEIVAWRAAYLLQNIAGNWMASAAFAEGEMAAWAARGTPLGAKPSSA